MCAFLHLLDAEKKLKRYNNNFFCNDACVGNACLTG